MKKVLLTLVLVSLFVMPVLVPVPVFADELIRPTDTICTNVKNDLTRYIANCKSGTTTIEGEEVSFWHAVATEEQQLCCILDIMWTFATWMFVVLLIVAGIIIILAAYQFMTAAGAPEKVNAARDKLIWALVGVAVAFLARGLVLLVTMLLT